MNYQKRRENLAHSNPEAARLLLVTEPKNLRYLSGFTGSTGWLLLHQSDHYLLTDGRYWEQVGRQSPDAKLFKYDVKKHQTLAGALSALLDELDTDFPLSVETDGMALADFRDIEKALSEKGRALLEVEGLTKMLRECKDEHEIELLRRAAAIADHALTETLKTFSPGATELDFRAEIEHQILKAGGEGTSFPTIIASGPNGSFPHAGASDRVIREHELITVDFGAVYRGYCSDMTRTIWYGTLPPELERLIRAVREAQQQAVDAVRAGITCSDLDSVARKVLVEHGLGEYFVHSLGHGVGLDIHESPGVRGTNSDPLKTGQVVTVEPGVYLPGVGGCRVEDTVVVEEKGCVPLNSFPKQSLGSTHPPARE